MTSAAEKVHLGIQKFDAMGQDASQLENRKKTLRNLKVT